MFWWNRKIWIVPELNCTHGFWYFFVLQEVKAVNRTVVGVRTRREEEGEDLGSPGRQVAANQSMQNRKRVLHMVKRLQQRLPKKRPSNDPPFLFLWPPWQQRLRWPPAELLPYLKSGDAAFLHSSRNLCLQPVIPPCNGTPQQVLWGSYGDDVMLCQMMSEADWFVLFSANHDRTIIFKLFLIRWIDLKFGSDIHGSQMMNP